ncbi:hypothetical protein EPA93_24665 [Ktedonosporobacter rubrisoli]|uniref:Uncharacterized protein n=1 Tax=Ktedonosporobacter rubrisoli TaxID=2509675 RepID=A0A4P6JU71_KTERU|nr:hypothetical protein [Ktedonosporobacter rubrisoli]QBD79004.1 hypothetical protein EPA93_24665 [Ktedonosporobacter rubrisoli]
MQESEVARVRQQIEEECEALHRALSGFAVASRHDIIHSRYKQLGNYQERLEKLMGEQAARETIVEIYQRLIG